MFFHLLYIHLFRPFLKYNTSNSPLPSHVSPRKVCSQAAGAISKLMRLYKRIYGLRQICNIAVYIVHSACTIHLLNLPEKTAKRDIIHGVKHLEEIAEDWLCARRTLSILSVLARKWKIDLPEEASSVFTRTDNKYGYFSTADVPSPKQELVVATPPSNNAPSPQGLQVSSTGPLTQSQLQQSMYSYLPDGSPTASNSMQNSSTTIPNTSQSVHQAVSTGVTAIDVPNQHMITSVPYARYPDASMQIPVTTSGELPRKKPTVTSDMTRSMGRQMAPNLFGGVEALVESQDWWLRDQANLFGNWLNFSGSPPDMTAGSPTASTPQQIDARGNGYSLPNTNGHSNTNGNGAGWGFQ